MVDVVVFAALSWEARTVLDGLQGVEPVAPRQWRGYLGDGATVAVRQVGVGVEQARIAAEQAPPARLFVSAGCAGALAGGLHAGDLVLAERVIELDRAGRVAREHALSAVAIAEWAATRGIALRTGAIASSPVVLAKRNAKARAGRLGGLAVEMECAGVAAVAATRGIDCAVVKVVLDEATDEVALPGDALIDGTTGEIKLSRAVRTLVPRPHYWPSVLRIARQQRVAERRLREFLGLLFSAGLEALGADASAPLAPARVG